MHNITILELPTCPISTPPLLLHTITDSTTFTSSQQAFHHTLPNLNPNILEKQK